MYIKDRLRRSMMFVPGNNPGMIRDAHIYGADSIMFDLEDSVAYAEKDAARLLVYNALRSLNFGSRETVVRINDLSSGLGIEDLEAVVRAGVQVVRLPKTDSAQDVIDCEREIARIERESGIPVGTTGMMAAIESANGVLNAAEIARASNRLIGIALGAEDYVTDLKTTRSDGIELLLSPLKRFHFPAHELAMMMSIALRFIPTLMEEADKIMKAQMARGADFETGNLFARAKAMIPLLVPLFVSAFRRAGELAMAMEARCYHGGENRTRLRKLEITKNDYIAGGAVLALILLIVLEGVVVSHIGGIF